MHTPVRGKIPQQGVPSISKLDNRIKVLEQNFGDLLSRLEKIESKLGRQSGKGSE